jgi:UDP-glucose 4-epimerase|tara:strand:+ start:408 stop:1271 length:864 start_codon:yes stop_codon:yes gene_type:complete
MKNKKVLITGGAGFIGSHLCERLLKEDCKIVVIDNYFTGTTDNHIDGVEYITGNTSDIKKMGLETPDIVYHLGEYSRVEQSFEDTDLVHKYNTQGTYEILEFVKDRGCKLVYAGSSTKFSDNGPDASPYAFTKAQNTQLVMNYGEWYNINYAITYFYNVYGPREIKDGRYATLIALFKEKVKKGENLQVVLPGTQKRNFTHVDDIVDGLVIVGDKGSGDGYGIGHDESYSVMDVAMMFSNYGKVGIDELPERRGNRMSGNLITEPIKLLGWYPKKNLKEYIKNGRRK